MQYTVRQGKWSEFVDFADYLKFSYSPQIKGPRGFIIKLIDTDQNKKKTLEKYGTLWPKTKDRSGNHNFNSIHFKQGLQHIYDKDRP